MHCLCDGSRRAAAFRLLACGSSSCSGSLTAPGVQWLLGSWRAVALRAMALRRFLACSCLWALVVQQLFVQWLYDSSCRASAFELLAYRTSSCIGSSAAPRNGLLAFRLVACSSSLCNVSSPAPGVQLSLGSWRAASLLAMALRLLVSCSCFRAPGVQHLFVHWLFYSS